MNNTFDVEGQYRAYGMFDTSVFDYVNPQSSDILNPNPSNDPPVDNSDGNQETQIQYTEPEQMNKTKKYILIGVGLIAAYFLYKKFIK